VKHWQELGQILDRLLRLARAGRPAALAIVTHIRGSAYRRPGAKLLVEEDGTSLGGVSGGCLEEDVRSIGQQVLQSGLSRQLHYETGDDDTKVWGLGLGCDGAVDIAVVPASAEAALGTWARVRELLDGDAPFALSTVAEDGGRGGVVVSGESGRVAGRLDDASADGEVDAAAAAALRAGRSTVQAAGPRTVFTEVLAPPPNLLVCGAGDDARPVVAFAAAVGLRVFVADHRAAYLTLARFPEARKLLSLRPEDESAELPPARRTYAVVMTHSLKRDRGWVKRLAATEAPYVGVLGPRARTEKMLAELPPRDRERVFGPVGLDLGADGPEQVALSILAEVLAVASRREPRHLRERGMSVHAV
jgi:xanthine/CO dehydrogenase XdhC/CoxF family maturation factor